jgi:hypothetical protein
VKPIPILVFAFVIIGCGAKYCPTYSTYEYNKEIVKEKSYKGEDAKAKRKMKKYNAR